MSEIPRSVLLRSHQLCDPRQRDWEPHSEITGSWWLVLWKKEGSDMKEPHSWRRLPGGKEKERDTVSRCKQKSEFIFTHQLGGLSVDIVAKTQVAHQINSDVNQGSAIIFVVVEINLLETRSYDLIFTLRSSELTINIQCQQREGEEENLNVALGLEHSGQCIGRNYDLTQSSGDPSRVKLAYKDNDEVIKQESHLG